ncbi:MAG: energy-coupling factor transporter transmembrane component T [Clostridia bacterium]|nr:energy-coupling factor transporter transmembrane component T [Clostridia bacterium]
MNLTIGQYYPAESVIHRLDARTKITATFIYIVAIFAAKGVLGYILCALLLGAVIKLCKVPFKMMLGGLKSIIVIIIFTVVLNMLFIRTGTEIISFGIIHITTDGIIMAVRLCIRLVMLILGSSVLTLVTSPIALTEGIESLLKPLKKIGVPAHEIAMMMSIALRFIPTLVDELDKIKKAQMARGADFDTGGLVAKAKSMIPLLVPLFVSAFRRADELAMAMEARCYRGDVNRTKMKELKYGKNDFIAYGTVILVTIAVILCRIFLGV